MKQFKDTQGRSWTIEVNIRQIRRVRDQVNVDLYSLFADEAKRLFSDPVLLVDTLYVLCQAQCEERKMSDRDFGEAFDGEVLEKAADALLEEVVSFFPQSRQTILRATINKSRELEQPIQTKVLEEINKLGVMDLLKPTA